MVAKRLRCVVMFPNCQLEDVITSGLRREMPYHYYNELSFPEVDGIFIGSYVFAVIINLSSHEPSQCVDIKCILTAKSITGNEDEDLLPWVIMSRDDTWVICGRSNKRCKISLLSSSLRDVHYAKKHVDTQTWTAKKSGCSIVIISEPFWRTCQKGKSTWVKINFAWKFVNKSQNKAQQIALLTLTMAKPLWGGRYFHPENCCGPWDPRVARKARDSEYFCRWSKNRSGPIQSVLRPRWMTSVCWIPNCETCSKVSKFSSLWKLISGAFPCQWSNTDIKTTSV